jgi:carbonic anhydrase
LNERNNQYKLLKNKIMKTLTKEMQSIITPKDAIIRLVEGNKRFRENFQVKRDLQNQVRETSGGQFPFAVVHSCIDSRVPVELVFDQGIGDIFSSRVAGNVINEDVLGSIEYACKVAGSKVVVVMGHTACGAVNAACADVKMGNISPLLQKINPAVEKIKSIHGSLEDKQIDNVITLNVEMGMERIREESPILKEMEEEGEIEIVGAIYSVSTGMVEFI